MHRNWSFDLIALLSAISAACILALAAALNAFGLAAAAINLAGVADFLWTVSTLLFATTYLHRRWKKPGRRN